jgi:hypothetical protein
MDDPRTAPGLVKSTRSAASIHCLETAFGHDGNVFVRDSKNPQGGILTFDCSMWSNFVAAVKSGDFTRR